MPIPDPDKLWPKLEKDGVDKVRKKLAMGLYAKYKRSVVEEWLRQQEQTTDRLEPKPPEIVQNIKWLSINWKQYWKFILLAGIILFILYIVNILVDSKIIFQKTKGEKSPAVITEGNVYVTYGVSQEVIDELINKQKLNKKEIEQLLKTIDQKDSTIEKRDAQLRELAVKYSELKSSLAKRSDEDVLIKQAEEKLIEGDLKGAEALLKKTLKNNYKELAERRSVTAVNAYQLGFLKELQLDYKTATTYYKKAAQLNPDNPSYLNSAGYLLFVMANYDEAESFFNRSLEIREKILGTDHPDVALSLNNLAGLYEKQGNDTKAEFYYKQSLEILKKALGTDHPYVATALNNLAIINLKQSKFAEAESLFKQSLQIREVALGPGHPDVATTLNNLAIINLKQDKFTEAESLSKQSLQIKEAALGPEHLDVATALNNLAEVYDKQGNDDEAEISYKRSLEIREKILGTDHPDVAESLNNLAGLYKKQRKYTKAEVLYKQSLQIMKKTLGPDHPNMSILLSNITNLYKDWGKENEVKRLLNGKSKREGGRH